MNFTFLFREFGDVLAPLLVVFLLLFMLLANRQTRSKVAKLLIVLLGFATLVGSKLGEGDLERTVAGGFAFGAIAMFFGLPAVLGILAVAAITKRRR